jgi:hypothetical protein
MNKKDASRVLHAVACDHVPEDINLLPGILARIEKGNRIKMRSRTKLLTVIVLVVLALVVILVSLPGVATAMKRLFGYIPEVGIVEQGAPLRMLAAPVSATRGGVTVSVNRAYLTAEKTMLDIGVSGVPLSAYPKGETVSGCIEQEYLRLPDGTKLDVSAPVPSTVTEATFVMPCIFNTLPGSAPIDWELALRFISAPPDLTVLPVIEISPSVPAATKSAIETPEVKIGSSATATSIPSTAHILVEKVIETEDGYILIGSVKPQVPEGSWIQVTGLATIRDANGKKVSYTYPEDVQVADANMSQGGFSWTLQIKGAGVSFPLTIGFSGVVVSQVDPQASAPVAFDAGPDPQPNQVWALNQDVQLAGNTVQLVSVMADVDGYSFHIVPGPHLSGVSVQIDGYQAIGGGGGGGGAKGAPFNTSLIYAELPKGQLTILLSNPLSTSDTQTWQGQWGPEAPFPDWPTPSVASYPVCLNPDSISQLKQLPDGLDGRVLLTELNPALNLVLAGMDGSQRRVLALGGSRGAMTQDGSRLAYSGNDGITILDLANGKASVLNGIQGRDLRWSPDSSKIAYVTAGDTYGLFVTGSDGKNPVQLSNLGYEAIAGWSPDGRQLYYAIPGSSNNGFLLRSVDLITGKTSDLFVLENSSRKAPMPVISPDGQWVAYRGADNSSLYLIHPDGTEAHKLIENPSPGYAVSGIAWGPGSGMLGVSLITPEDQDGEVILIQPSGCEAYQLPSLHGELDGVLIP